ncbi:hypothetical protein GEMRC1_012875 [Eukaryota sp. GEM-RC1]
MDFVFEHGKDKVFVLGTPDHVINVIGDVASPSVKARGLYLSKFLEGDYSGRSKKRSLYLSELRAGFDPLVSVFSSNLNFIENFEFDFSPSESSLFCLHYLSEPHTILYNADGALNEEVDLDEEVEQEALQYSDLGSACHFEKISLCSSGCYLIDAGDWYFCWFGKEADEFLKNSLRTVAKELAKNVENFQIFYASEGTEPCFFKCFFRNWMSPSEVRTIDFEEESEVDEDAIEEAEKDEAEKRAQLKTDLHQQFLNPDDQNFKSFDVESGKLEIYDLCDTKITSLDTEIFNIFYEFHSYVIVFTELIEHVNSSPQLNFHIFFWRGALSPPIHAIQFQLVLVPLLKEQIFNAGGGNRPNVVTINQGEETPLFLSLFNGFFVVKKRVSEETCLFQLQSNPVVTLACQVDPRPLSSNNCWLLYTKENSYLWLGSDCGSDYKESCRTLIDEFFDIGVLIETQRGREPSKFHEYFKSLSDTEVSYIERTQLPKLFSLQYNSEFHPKLVLEVILSKSVLDCRKVAALDCGNELFLWIGKYSDKYLVDLARSFLNLSIVLSDRDESCEFIEVDQDSEPDNFKYEFLAWHNEHRYYQNFKFDDPYLEKSQIIKTTEFQNQRLAFEEMDRQRRHRALLFHLLLKFSFEKNYAFNVLAKFAKFIKLQGSCEKFSGCLCSYACIYNNLKSKKSIKFDVSQILAAVE